MKIFKEIKRCYKIGDSYVRKLFKGLAESKASIVVILLVVAIFILAFKMEIHYGKARGFLDANFWLDSLLPNIIADMIGIIFTSFIIAGLFAHHQKKSEEKRLRDILGYDFWRLIDLLSRNFLYLLHRNDEILSFYADEKRVKNELKDLASYKENSFDFLKFNSNFRVWNINEGSPIYDCFVVLIEKIADHEKITWSHLDDIDELFLKKGKMEIELAQHEPGTEKHDSLMAEYKKVREELRYRVRFKMPMDEKLLDVKIRDVLLGCMKFYEQRIQIFCDKYNFIIPIEIRSSFAEIEKKLSSIQSDLYAYNNFRNSTHLPSEYENIDIYGEALQKSILESVAFISQALLNLSRNFKR